ncbi:MAG: M20/M25/M40 family metallo-hydrolase, partial [Patescibacteria group bacterium]
NQEPDLYCRVDLDAVSIGDKQYLHSCGHSTNMSGVLTAVTKAKIDGLNVGIIFQPAEEGPGNAIDGYVQSEGLGGGQYLRKKGVYEKIPALISCHIDTSLKDDEVRISKDAATAAAYRFTYRAVGKPAHAALPWQGENPLDKVNQFLTDLKSVFVDLPRDEYGLVTASKVNTAECELNSLSPWAEVRGISRNIGPNSLKLFEKFMQTWDARIELEAPPVINDAELAEIATMVALENRLKVITEPAKFRDETAWAGPLSKPWVKNPDTYKSGCSTILHFFTAAYNAETGGLHSDSFNPDFEKAIDAQVQMIYGIILKYSSR